MIEVVINDFTKAQLESKDINLLASKL